MQFFSKIKSNNERTLKAQKNILGMLVMKGGNILIGLLLVPLTINYVNSETYGVWLAISSMVTWISFLDIGINNGLKNKLTEALANGDTAKAKAYVSTTYAILALIFIPLMLALLTITPFVDWQTVLNVSNIEGRTLVYAMCIVLAYFCINFVLSTINVILLADQRPADVSLRSFLEQLLTLGVIYTMTKFVPGSLQSLCIALCACPLFLMILFNVIFLSGRYRAIAPSVSHVQFGLSKDLLKLGVQFFIIQIAGIVQYQMINFLIIHYIGAGEVTAYNIAYKYFNIVYMVWIILTTPIWAAVTDAVAKGDFAWIRSTTSKYIKLLLLFAVCSMLMLIASPYVYDLWIGNSVTVSFELSLWVMLYNFAMMFSAVFVSILNGASILKVQTIASIISPFVFIGCCMLLLALGFGTKAILISSIVANFNGLILAPCQYIRFIRRNKASIA